MAFFLAPAARLRAALTALILVSAPAALLHAAGATETAAPSATTVNVVAAENFYGDMAKQIGGSHVSVTSIMSDPNVDPHEYESSVDDGRAIAGSQLVIENGSGYDDWMDKLLAASPSGSRIVLTGFDLAVTKLPENEHVWYNPDNAEAIAKAIGVALSKLDPADGAYFDHTLQVFVGSLDQIRQKMAEIKARYANTPVGLTETIYLYQALPMGLDVLTPFEFQKAIAEGNDPPADAAVTAESQVTGKQIKVLIYNEQTITPITTKLQGEAKAEGIPVFPVTETMPQGLHYQTWMMAQLNELERLLGG